MHHTGLYIVIVIPSTLIWPVMVCYGLPVCICHTPPGGAGAVARAGAGAGAGEREGEGEGLYILIIALACLNAAYFEVTVMGGFEAKKKKEK